MNEYRVTRYCVIQGADYEPGTILTLDEQVAARISSESEGLLEPWPPAQPEPVRSVDAAPQDRMVRKASKRGAMMAGSYATLAEFKLALGISDTTDDLALSALLGAVSREIDAYCARRFDQETDDALLHGGS